MIKTKPFSSTYILIIILLLGFSDLKGVNRYSVASGNWNSSATWSSTSGGSSGYSAPAAGDVVYIEGGYTVTTTANAACTNLIIESASALNVGAFNINISSTTSISGTMTLTGSAGTKRFTGLVTINTGGVWNNTGNSQINFRGGITNDGTFNAGSGLHTFSSNAQEISGNISIPNITVTTITLTNTGVLTISNALSGSGGLTNASDAELHLNFSGTLGITTLTASAAGNKIDYGYAGNQTIKATTYSNLTLSQSGVKTFATGTSTIQEILSMEGSCTSSLTGTLAYGTSASLHYSGSVPQTTGPEFPATFNGSGGVVINNTYGVNLGAAKTISSKLDLTNGILNTSGTNLLSISNPSVTGISGGSTTSFINGPVKWTLPPGLISGSTYLFPIGKGTVYLPFELVNPTSGTGTITAQAEAFTSNPGGSSGVTLIARSTTEYWSLVTSGNFTNSSISLTRQSPVSPYDAIGGSNAVAGTYNSLGGTANINGVINSDAIGTSRFFVFASKRSISTGMITGSSYCPGSNISVPFSITGTFTAGNIFTAQLSNASGSFNTPVNIGNFTSQTGGTINATIPASQGAGSAYRIRVVSSNPIITGSDNGDDFQIANPSITGTYSAARCGPGPVTLSATSFAGIINWYASLTGGTSLGTGTTFVTPSISSSTTYFVDASNNGCTSSPRVAIMASVITPSSISAFGGGTYCTGSTLNLTSTGTNVTNQYWQGPDDFYTVEQNPVITNLTSINSGTYTVTGSSVSGVNLVTNGDFEAGNTGFGSSYGYVTPSGSALNPEGLYTIVSNPNSVHSGFTNCADHTPTGTLQMVINGAVTAGVSVWEKSVNVQTGTDYQFSYWVQSVVAGNPSQLQLFVNGVLAGPVYTAITETCQWKQFIYNWSSGSETVANLSLVNQNIIAGGNDFSLDDIIFQQVCSATAVVYKSGNNSNGQENLESNSVDVIVSLPSTAGAIGNTQTICRGSLPTAISSTTVGTGSGTISYEWQTNASGSYTTLAGATNATYSPPALSNTTSYQRRTVATSGGTSCYSPYTTPVTITVTGPLISAGGPNALCQSSSPAALPLSGASYSGSGATGAAWSIVSGGGMLSSTNYTTNPANVTYTPASNYTGTILLRLTTAGGTCNSIAERTITISPLPSASISYPGSPYCMVVSTPQNVTFSGTAGGTFTASPAGLQINGLTGAVIPSTSTSGTYTVTYSIAAAGGCGLFTTTTTVTIVRDQVWTGAVNTDWNTAGNWYCGIVPDLLTSVQIPNVTNKPVLSTGATGTANNINISAGSSLTVIGNTLQIAGSVTNNGSFTSTAGTIEMRGTSAQSIGLNTFALNTVMNLTINNPAGVSLLGPLKITGIVKTANGELISGGNLLLISNSSQTALIEGTGSGQITGNVTMQRYLSSGFGYKYFSSPFQNATVNEFADDINLSATFPTFYKYDEDNHRDSSGVAVYSTGWSKYIIVTDPLLPMNGYAANFGTSAAAKTVEITGVVNNNISTTQTLYNHNRPYTKGFNLIGNPYPSPIDWDATTGWTRTNLDNAIYYFDAGTTNQYTGTYSSYAGGVSSNGIAGRIIPSMQGFFVHVTNGTTGTLGMNNQVRVNTLSPSFHKSANENFRTLIRITAAYETEIKRDPAVIYFNESATDEFDKDLDALKMMNTDESVPNFYALTPQSIKASISAIPYPNQSITKVPLGLITGQNGSVMIKTTDIEHVPENLHVFLSDEQTGLIQDMQKNPEYLVHLEKGTIENRFYLIFSENDLEHTSTDEDLFFASVQNGKLSIFVGLGTGTSSRLLVCNLLGQVVLQQNLYGNGSHEITQNLPAGIYVLALYSQKGLSSQKIYIPN